MHDIGLEHVWDLDALPWSRVTASAPSDSEASPNRELVEMLARFAAGDAASAAHATQSFLYLYLRLARRDEK